MFATISSSGRIRRLISTRGRAITNDTKISMARAIVGNRATGGSDQRPMYDQLLRPTTDRTINRGDRSYDQSCRPATDGMINRCILRPNVRALVESCGRVYDQLCHPTVDRRSIVASCDRSLRPTTDRTINRDTKRPIVRSIVASCYRSYDQSCDFRSAIINSWWCHHARLVVRSRKTYLRPLTIWNRRL